jgi:gentisate 1,2-dioxygenase
MATEQAPANSAMEEFYKEINAKSFDALWRQHGPPTPGAADARPPYQPHLWRWADMEPFLHRATELVKPSHEDQRRVLTLNNPSVNPAHSATHTISGAVQVVLPGEIAPSHRHTMAAIRFVMKGKGAVTFIDGEGCTMNPGDLILTPGWTYHGHINQGDGPMIWMDSLDVPLVISLKQGLYEEYPDQLFPADRPVDDSLHRYGRGHLRPVWDKHEGPISPLLSFPWEQTERALRELAESDSSPFDDVAFEYTHPTTGGHVLPTIGCWIQMLKPAARTQAHRHSSVAVYHVFRGSGHTVIDGVQMDWEEGDFFAIPPYAWHEHHNPSKSDEAVLFSTNDIPVLESLNLYREQPYVEHGGHQPVTGKYEDAAPTSR